jgi:hypothetical protein
MKIISIKTYLFFDILYNKLLLGIHVFKVQKYIKCPIFFNYFFMFKINLSILSMSTKAIFHKIGPIKVPVSL